MGGRLRARDVPALPLLFLLHLFLTLSSLFVRTYELLTNPDADNDGDSLISTSAGSPNRKAPVPNPPKHVGMVLLPPSAEMGGQRGRKAVKAERARVVECLLNFVELAADEGVPEISIYEASGLLESAKADIMTQLQSLPLSPPTSEPRTSSGTHTPSEQLHEVGDHSKESGGRKNHVTTLTVFSPSNYAAECSSSATTPRRLTVHLLSPSSADVVAAITSGFLAESISPNDITLNMLDDGIRSALHFSRDVDLLIVHTLYEPTGWRSWLPRRAPELGGYPFWTLRISEIYHHSPPLPLLSLFKPLLHLARTSTLPFLRKLGRLVPPPLPHNRNEMLDLYSGPGRIDREEWAGAMRAWRAVEQRLGR